MLYSEMSLRDFILDMGEATAMYSDQLFMKPLRPYTG